jgi:hypothetical protein
VTILAGIVSAATFHFDRNDVEWRIVVSAASLSVKIDSANLRIRVRHGFRIDGSMTAVEQERSIELREAQAKAEQLFREVESRGLIRPDITENGLNDEIYALAKEMYGIGTYWHKGIVRADPNALPPYDETLRT